MKEEVSEINKVETEKGFLLFYFSSTLYLYISNWFGYENKNLIYIEYGKFHRT